MERQAPVKTTLSQKSSPSLDIGPFFAYSTYTLVPIRMPFFTTNKPVLSPGANTKKSRWLGLSGWGWLDSLDVRQLEVGMEEIDALAVHET